MSPLLLNIALELLAIGIRGHPYIKGIRSGITETRVALYANDLLICLADPVVSIPVLLEYINSFGSISGYKINWRKSEFMPLTDQFTDDQVSIPFPELAYVGSFFLRNLILSCYPLCGVTNHTGHPRLTFKNLPKMVV